MAQPSQQSSIVIPVHPRECGQFHFCTVFPALTVYYLRFVSLLTVLAVGAWLFTISLLLSLVSIVVIMKLFYQYEQRFGMRSTSLLNVIGSNTIAIYTTHRILVEIFSLTLLAQMNAARCPYTVPALSSVKIPVTEMIQEIIGRLIFMLDGGDFSPPKTFSGKLIRRDSLIAPSR